MKVLPFTIPKPSRTAVLYQLDTGQLYEQLHQHDEVQISWIEAGEGTLFAGDAIHQYYSGSLFVLGGQQPHVFRGTDTSARMHTVFFSLEGFGNVFLDLEEGKGIKEFYAFAKAGLKTTATSEIKDIYRNIAKNKGIEKLQDFLKLILLLNNEKAEPLSTFIYKRTISEADGKRMNAILNYTMNTYDTSISLDVAAQKAMMTRNAFCKYFKQRTDKTYFKFINELRIQKACNLLIAHPEMPINQIAHLCGFQTLSHFNKKFKVTMQMVPRTYRQSLLKS